MKLSLFLVMAIQKHLYTVHILTSNKGISVKTRSNSQHFPHAYQLPFTSKAHSVHCCIANFCCRLLIALVSVKFSATRCDSILIIDIFLLSKH